MIVDNNIVDRKYLNKRGLCEYLGKVEKMMYDEGLRYVKFGRNVRFDVNDVDDYMNRYKVS